MSFIKKLFGIPEDTEVRPQKIEQEKTIGDFEYELAKRKAREQREREQEVNPDGSSDLSSGQ